jgi:group I intron endonuclease
MLVYIATNLVNGKRYVGITGQSLPRRIKDHRLAAKNGSPTAFHCAIRKYGFENFSFEHVASARSRSDLREAERQIIVQEGTSVPHGYNMTPGGDGRTGKMPARAIPNMAAAQRRTRATETIEARLARNAAISAAKKGKKQPWASQNGKKSQGVRRSDDFRDRVSKGMSRYIQTLPPGEMSRRGMARWSSREESLA